jgi:hypothetical protein
VVYAHYMEHKGAVELCSEIVHSCISNAFKRMARAKREERRAAEKLRDEARTAKVSRRMSSSELTLRLEPDTMGGASPSFKRTLSRSSTLKLASPTGSSAASPRLPATWVSPRRTSPRPPSPRGQSPAMPSSEPSARRRDSSRESLTSPRPHRAGRPTVVSPLTIPPPSGKLFEDNEVGGGEVQTKGSRRIAKPQAQSRAKVNNRETAESGAASFKKRIPPKKGSTSGTGVKPSTRCPSPRPQN